MTWTVWLEALSYLVTIIGLAFTLADFFVEQRKLGRSEQDTLYRSLAGAYTEFIARVLEHSDLQLLTRSGAHPLNGEPRKRQLALFDTLLGIFEQAFILVYHERMFERKRRLWQTWEN